MLRESTDKTLPNIEMNSTEISIPALPSTPNIVNLHKVYDVNAWIKAGGVYCGRKIDTETFKHEGSKWGNSHTVREHKSRKKVVDLFREDIMNDEELLKDIGELKGKVLGCWCSPEQCHCEVLHELAWNFPTYEDTAHPLVEATPESESTSFTIESSNESLPSISSISSQSVLDESKFTLATNNGDAALTNVTSKSTLTPQPSPTFPSNPPTPDLNAVIGALNTLQADNLLQQDRITKLEKRISSLEGTLIQNNARLTVRDHVVEALKGEVNRLQQFTRRYCVAVSGIDKQEGETPEILREKVTKLVAEVKSTTTEHDIDKFHRNGRVTNGNEQEVIIRFKSHAAKEAFYRARKDLPPARKAVVKIRPSLSLNQQNLLRDALSFVDEYSLKDEEINPVDFVFANVHGEIQAKLKNKFRGSCFIAFNNVQDLARKLQDAQVEKDREADYDKTSSWADPDLHQKPEVPSQNDDDDDMGFGLFK